ncbi:hypothetical protein EC973_006113 [Apophysomyces ossiformis]|uniref:RhoGAP-domain-containing protein n=1 Tax=Apophysomyces ossiformis TaxID=679940 RepID=A0A8H7BYZ8_9FUNG|nr:hypothetical protein EC973_006113 [Apophysomyces ossiformis]
MSTKVVPPAKLPDDFAAQNDQLWKIIEQQRLIIQDLQKALSKITTERDALLKKNRELEQNSLVPPKPLDYFDSRHQRHTQSEALQSTEPCESTTSPVPPPRSPYRQHSSKDNITTTIHNTIPNTTPNSNVTNSVQNDSLDSSEYRPPPLKLAASSQSSRVKDLQEFVESPRNASHLSQLPFTTSPRSIHDYSFSSADHILDKDAQIFAKYHEAVQRKDGSGIPHPSPIADPFANRSHRPSKTQDSPKIRSEQDLTISCRRKSSTQDRRIESMDIPRTHRQDIALFGDSENKYTLPLEKQNDMKVQPFTFGNNSMMGIRVKVLGSNIKLNEKGKEVVSFTISVGKILEPSDQDGAMEELWRVEKFHSDILGLDAQLKMRNRGVSSRLGKLPDKALFSSHAPSKVDVQKRSIEKYLQEAILLPLNDITDLCEFLSTNVVDQMSVPADPPGHKQGYLTKRGKNFGGWKVRYFVLNGPELKYYESQNGPTLGTVHLGGAQIGRQLPLSQMSPEVANDPNSYRHAFMILERKKSAPHGVHRHILCAGSDMERDEWVEALSQHINAPKQVNRDIVPKKEKRSKKGEKPRKFSNNETKSSSRPKHEVNLPRSVSDTTLPPAEVNTSESSIASSFNLNELNPSTLRHRSSYDHIPFYMQAKHRQDSDNRIPRDDSYVTYTSNDSLSQAHTKLLEDQQDEEALEAKKARQKLNRRTFWGKKIFSSAETQTGSTPTAVTGSNSQQTGLRNFLSRSTNEVTDKGQNMTNSLLQDGSESSKPILPVFGVPLEEAVQISKISDKYELPAIVHRCIEYLEAKNAFEEEGIYRLSGSAMKIKALKNKFNEEGDVRLLEAEEHYDLHVIAGLLKMWLRELPGNVLTTELMKEFLHVIDLIDRQERITELGRLVSMLPLANYTLLRALSSHLIRIVQNAEINKMNMRNVGIVFSATLGIPAGIFSLFLTEFDYVFWTEKGNHVESVSHVYQIDYRLGPAPTQPLHPALTAECRNNRNSMIYADGAPRAIVGLEQIIDPLIDEDEQDGGLFNDENDLISSDEETDRLFFR